MKQFEGRYSIRIFKINPDVKTFPFFIEAEMQIEAEKEIRKIAQEYSDDNDYSGVSKIIINERV